MNKYCTGGQPERVYVCERGPPFLMSSFSRSTHFPYLSLSLSSVCVEGRACLANFNSQKSRLYPRNMHHIPFLYKSKLVFFMVLHGSGVWCIGCNMGHFLHLPPPRGQEGGGHFVPLWRRLTTPCWFHYDTGEGEGGRLNRFHYEANETQIGIY